MGVDWRQFIGEVVCLGVGFCLVTLPWLIALLSALTGTSA